MTFLVTVWALHVYWQCQVTTGLHFSVFHSQSSFNINFIYDIFVFQCVQMLLHSTGCTVLFKAFHRSNSVLLPTLQCYIQLHTWYTVMSRLIAAPIYTKHGWSV